MPNSPVKMYWGQITQVFGPPEGQPTSIRYSAVAIDTMDSLVITNHLPRRRISQGAEVIAAGVGDVCVIQVNPAAPNPDDRLILWALTEGIPFEEC